MKVQINKSANGIPSMSVVGGRFLMEMHSPPQGAERTLSLGFDFPDDFAFCHLSSAIYEALNLDNGRKFLVPSIEKALGKRVDFNSISKNIEVHKFQEGHDSAIFKVVCSIKNEDGGYEKVAFCLTASRSPNKNDLHGQIFKNLEICHLKDPRFIVKPFVSVKTRGICMYSTEWLEDYYEINTYNLAEETNMRGCEVLGIPVIQLNNQVAMQFNANSMKNPDVSGDILKKMVRAIFAYYSFESGAYISAFEVNSGDFVIKCDENGFPIHPIEVKLITARKYETTKVPQEFRQVQKYVWIANFVSGLIMHAESTPRHQGTINALRREIAVYPFSGESMLAGLREAHEEIFGKEQGLHEFVNLSTFLINSLEQAISTLTFQDRQLLFLLNNARNSMIAYIKKIPEVEISFG